MSSQQDEIGIAQRGRIKVEEGREEKANAMSIGRRGDVRRAERGTGWIGRTDLVGAGIEGG